MKFPIKKLEQLNYIVIFHSIVVAVVVSPLLSDGVVSIIFPFSSVTTICSD